jgi:hypothetical protein
VVQSSMHIPIRMTSLPSDAVRLCARSRLSVKLV